MSDQWLSNAYLVADEPGGHAVIVRWPPTSYPVAESERGITVHPILNFAVEILGRIERRKAVSSSTRA